MEFVKLGDIVTIKKGKKPLFSELPNEKSVRVLQIGDLRNDNNLKFTDDKTGVLVDAEDVLLAWDGANAGTVGYGKTGYIGSTIAVLKKKNSKYYSTVFIGKFLQSQFEYLRSKATGATIPHIDRKSLDSLKLPVIDFTEQIRIAEILSQAENLITQRKEGILLLDELLKSTFLEMFGQSDKQKFPLQKLDKVSLKITDGEHGTVNRLEYGKLYFMARNITVYNTIDLKEVSFISDEDHNKIFKRCNPEQGDLMMVCVGATIGKVVLVPENMEPFSLARSVALIKPNKSIITSEYLLWFFNSELGKRQIKNSTNAAAQGGLYTGKLKNINISIPPIALQNKFATIVKKVEILKSEYQASLKELENMYGVLSQKAFKGELKVKEYTNHEALGMVAETKGEY